MLGRFAPGICRASGPGQVIGDVSRQYVRSIHSPLTLLGRRSSCGLFSVVDF